MKRFLFFIGFIVSTQISFAQLPSLKTAIDKRQILIGEQLKYQVEASFPSGTYQITWFNVPDSFSHFEIVTRGKIDTLESKGKLILRQTLTLTSFDSGINTIPALAINFDPLINDSSIHLFTDSIPINVSYSPLDSIKPFHGIKSIIEVKDEIPMWMWIAGGALIILLIILIIYLIKYFRKRKKPETLFNSKLSPIDEAMLSLDALQKEQLLFKEEIKQFHTRMTDIFKRYLSRKMQRDMHNLTSSDILVVLNDMKVSKIDTSIIAGSLRMTDAVKFAKYSPPASESEAALINTKKVITQIDNLIFTTNPTLEN
ncbi:MAG TPA: hypothetical protein VGP43_07145 [Chitinophagaceae bacterium]|nr:hypothetical protein [Chitinophagaceae bacterium]